MTHQVPTLPSTHASQAAYSTYYLALINDYDALYSSSLTDAAFRDAEKNAMLALVPRPATTKLFAVDSGTWNSAGNWYPAGVPAANDKVTIGEGCVCTYDLNNTSTSMTWIRVDGTLQMDPTLDCALKFDTMVITSLGTRRSGTRSVPVSANKTHQWIIDTGRGDIDVSVDTFLQSRGILCMGTGDDWGATKTPWLKVSGYAAPVAGDTSLTLESTPTNWAVGDEIVICSTRLAGASWYTYGVGIYDNEDERKTITSISAGTVGWSGGLVYDHTGFVATANRPLLRAYVMNLTRNIKFKPSDSSVIPQQRGHMMQMHNPLGWSMRYAEVGNLGRTSKLNNPWRERITFGAGPTAAGASLNLTSSPYWSASLGAIYTGSTFLVQKEYTCDSAGTYTVSGFDETGAAITDTVSYNAGATYLDFGTKFFYKVTSIVFTSAMSGNLPIMQVCQTSRQMNQNGVRNLTTGAATYSAVTTHTNIQGRYPFHWHKLGVTGTILTSPPVVDGCSFYGSPGWLFAHHRTYGIVKDSVFYDAGGAGLVAEDGNESGLWIRNLSANFYGNYDFSQKRAHDKLNKDAAISGTPFWFTGRLMKVKDNVGISGVTAFSFNTRLFQNAPTVAQADQPTSQRSRGAPEVEDFPIDHFDGNVCVACTRSLFVIKDNPNQNHNVRSLLSNTTIWSCSVGAEITYTQHYTLKDWYIFHGRTSGSLEHAGDPYTAYGDLGVIVGVNTTDIAFVNITVEKMNRDIIFEHVNTDSSDGNFNQTSPLVARAGIHAANNTYVDTILHSQNFNAVDVYLTNEQLSSDVPTLTGLTTTLVGNQYRFEGTQSDAFGSRVFPWGQEHYYVNLVGDYSMASLLTDYGYWTYSGNSYLIVDEWFASAYSATLDKVRNKINLTALGISTTGYTNNGAINLANTTPPTLAAFTVNVDTNVNKDVNIVSRALGNTVTFGGKQSSFKTNIVENTNGTITLVPLADENYTETAYVWVNDINGNTTKAAMTIVVAAPTSEQRVYTLQCV